MKKIIMVLLMSILLLSCGDSQEVQMVKNGTLNIYPNKTLGEAIEGFVSNPEWESIVAEDGNKYVNIIGTIKYYEKDTKIGLQYKINGNTFEFNALEFNGVPQDMFIYGVLIKKIYEENN